MQICRIEFACGFHWQYPLAKPACSNPPVHGRNLHTFIGTRLFTATPHTAIYGLPLALPCIASKALFSIPLLHRI
jgi:hypothetical protein